MDPFDELLSIVKQLRNPDGGCPWDRKQTPLSLLPYMLEEVYELFEAIEGNNQTKIQEELGDVLLHIVFQIILAEENRQFDARDVVNRINAKLRERHPHVFDTKNFEDMSELKTHWEKTKQKKGQRHLLDGVPRHAPALLRAQRVQEKVSAVGFDWTRHSDVVNKIDEEWRELRHEIIVNNREAIEEEMGDLLFALVNLARHLHLSAEWSLQRGIDKFIGRFNKVEEAAGFHPELLSIAELDELWNQVKKSEKK